MYAIGRLADNERLAEVGLYGTEALFVGAGVGSVLKDAFGRARPFVDTAGPNPMIFSCCGGFTPATTIDRFRRDTRLPPLPRRPR